MFNFSWGGTKRLYIYNSGAAIWNRLAHALPIHNMSSHSCSDPPPPPPPPPAAAHLLAEGIKKSFQAPDGVSCCLWIITALGDCVLTSKPSFNPSSHPVAESMWPNFFPSPLCVVRPCEHIPGRAAGFTNSTINLICVGKRRIWYGRIMQCVDKKEKKKASWFALKSIFTMMIILPKRFLYSFFYLELTGRERRNAFKNTLGIYAYYSCLFSWSTKWSHKTKT